MIKENCCRVSITKEGKLKVILPKHLFLNVVTEFRKCTNAKIWVNSGDHITVKNIEVDIKKSQHL